MEIKHVKASEFNNEVLKSDKPVLVDFWADWCGPCKMLGPVLEQVAAKVDDVQIVKINVDEESSVAEKYNIMSILIFYLRTLIIIISYFFAYIQIFLFSSLQASG